MKSKSSNCVALLAALIGISYCGNLSAESPEAPAEQVVPIQALQQQPQQIQTSFSFWCRFKRVDQTERKWMAVTLSPGTPPFSYDYGDGVKVELQHMGGAKLMVWLTDRAWKKKPTTVDGRRTVQLAMGTGEIDLSCYRQDYLSELER